MPWHAHYARRRLERHKVHNRWTMQPLEIWFLEQGVTLHHMARMNTWAVEEFLMRHCRALKCTIYTTHRNITQEKRWRQMKCEPTWSVSPTGYCVWYDSDTGSGQMQFSSPPSCGRNTKRHSCRRTNRPKDMHAGTYTRLLNCGCQYRVNAKNQALLYISAWRNPYFYLNFLDKVSERS